MLQYRAVEQGTLDILKRLMMEPALGSFYLAGGTALALYRGHRMLLKRIFLISPNYFRNTLLRILLPHIKKSILTSNS